ncbi:MAG: deoxyribonuclease IV [Deltaproteobacteria bacterium]|nr:deoxyribonuclease IV [Deltaproteobacteria bacterium]
MDRKITCKTDADKKSCCIGAHFSIAKGLDRALYDAAKYQCTAAQIFTKNALTWKERTVSAREIERFEQARIKTGIRKIASHASYLINLATHDRKKHDLSCHGLKQELHRSALLDIAYVVLHPGSHMGSGETTGIDRIAERINSIFTETKTLKPRLLLETTAGQGSSVGHTFEQLASILEKIEDQDRIGVCLDTSHVFAAGFDIRTPASYRKTIQRFDSVIGLHHLHFIHLNDSKTRLGSRVDRHEHIGRGFIGLKAFASFMNDMRLFDIPKIIETPKFQKGKDGDKINLEQLRSLIHPLPVRKPSQPGNFLK